VASRSIGFEIYNSGKISEKDFDVHFLLWGRGGPNWEFEEKKYYLEQDAEWTHIQRSKRKSLGKLSVFKRLSFPSKFEPVISPPSSLEQTESKSFISSNHNNADNERKSYAQVVNGNNSKIMSNSLPTSNYGIRREIWVPKKVKSLHLPGLIPFMKYTSFPAPDPSNWPDSPCLSWFRAHGPALPIKTFSSFKELFSFHFSAVSSFSPASSPSTATVNPSSPPRPAAAPAKSVAMANIPIDPQPFVPPGFQIQHIEGRTAVHRVVLPRRPRRHEEYAIATIQPMPEGQVLFDNIRDVLEDFFANVARVGVRDVQKCPFGQAYVRFAHFRDRDRLVAHSPHQF
jgi:hypothetical protein